VWDALVGLIKRGVSWVHASAVTARGRQVGSQEFPEAWQPVQISGRVVSSAAPSASVLPPPEKEPRFTPVTLDEVCVSLGALNMSMRRWFTSVFPHEVSVFVPHAELRIRKGRGVQETEITLDSITIVHAPRHPPAKPGRATENSG